MNCCVCGERVPIGHAFIYSRDGRGAHTTCEGGLKSMGTNDPWWENAFNDIGHIAWLGVPLGFVPLVTGSPWGLLLGGVTGLVHGAVIEFLKETPDDLADTFRDLAGYFVGGLLGGLVLWLA